MLTRSGRKVLFWSSVVIFIAMIPVAILYALGYRLDDAWSLKKTGAVYVSAEIPGSEIYVDGEFERRTNLLQSGVFVDNLSPGAYEILVLNQNYFPWKKKLEVRSQLVTEAQSFLVPVQTNAKILLRGKFSNLRASPSDPLIILTEEKSGLPTGQAGEKILRWYLPLSQEFLSDTGSLLQYEKSFEVVRWLPEGVILKLDGQIYQARFNLSRNTATIVPPGGVLGSKSPEEIAENLQRKDSRGELLIQYSPENKTLGAKWISESEPPRYFSGREETLLANHLIKNFEIYTGRRDIVIAAFDNGIWAIEIDGRGGRIIQPIYKGGEPDFAIVSGRKELYILDGGILFAASLTAED